MKADPLTKEAFRAVKDRSDKAWIARSPWNSLYQDAYDYVVPQRRPTAQRLNEIPKLYDMTAPMAAMYAAGRLQRNLFPPGQDQFVIEAGPIAQQYLTVTAGPEAVATVNRELDKTTKVIQPFFMTGEWDTCVHEACVDLQIGTCAILPLSGDQYQPLRFATIPFDEIAIWCDFYGNVCGVSWKTSPTRDELYWMWQDAAWPPEFKDRQKTHPNEEVELRQVWYKDAQPGGGWHFIAIIDKMESEIVHERMRTQPIAIGRYYRIPGEAYGRGTALTALPSIKTLNKAQELTLKAAAIQMLGIWAYRAGGTFNPSTVRFGPGEFWPMQSTGGILGPDVSRMDPASGNISVSNLLIGDLQEQVKSAMNDTRLPEKQGTPRSASEITGFLQQSSEIHIGADGRLISEIMPVIVPRAAEILYDQRFLQTVQSIDNLLIAARARSPMTAALNADKLAAIAHYHEIGAAIAGPERIRLYENEDAVMAAFARGLQIDQDIIPDADQKKQAQQDILDAQKQQLAMIMAQETAKAAPKAIAGAAVQQGKQAA